MTEVYLLFFQSIMPSFTHCNQFLQQQEPLIHVLQNILAKFVKPSVIAEHLRADTLTSIDFKNGENHVGNNCLSVGFLTKQSLDKLTSPVCQICHGNKGFFNSSFRVLAKVVPFRR
jgi:hypothetical protein